MIFFKVHRHLLAEFLFFTLFSLIEFVLIHLQVQGSIWGFEMQEFLKAI